MLRLFPPFLQKGKKEGDVKDVGPNGPVRFLQSWLFTNRPYYCQVVGLIPDGVFWDKTHIVITLVQYEAITQRRRDPKIFKIDGGLDPDTRAYIREAIGFDFDAVPRPSSDEIVAASANCYYVEPGSDVVKLWDEAAARVAETVRQAGALSTNDAVELTLEAIDRGEAITQPFIVSGEEPGTLDVLEDIERDPLLKLSAVR